MLSLSRRDVIASAAFAAALGLDKRLTLIASAQAQTTADPAPGFHTYKVGDIEVTALYDGIWEKPHDPAFIKNASVEETKEALAKGRADDGIRVDPADRGRSQDRRQAT